MPHFNTLEEYAEHIRRTTCRLIMPLCQELGVEHRVSVVVAELCTEAANVANGLQMAEERAALDTLDLAKLPMPVFVEDRNDPYQNE